MIVVGGTYLEHCQTPYRNRIMGSGLRAACALSAVDTDLRLYSSIDEHNCESAEITAGSFSFNISWTKRSKPVQFMYFTPLFSPALIGHDASSGQLDVEECQAALVFGMTETTATVSSDFLIFDPQHARSFNPAQFKCKHLAIVANVGETMNIGESSDIRTAGKNVIAKFKAEAVITKLGARGVLVTTSKYQDEIGPHPTQSVMPIGSGDVFSAAFAWVWANSGADAIEAARVGSAATAQYVSTETLPIPRDVLVGESFLEPPIEPRDVEVYLAGPFFSLSELWLVDNLYLEMSNLGARIFSPYHHVGKGGLEVAQKDIEGLRKCNSVLALLDNLDAGTLFEVGWAIKAGIPVVGYASKLQDEANKMLCGSGVEWHNDLSSAVYRSIWRGMGAPSIHYA